MARTKKMMEEIIKEAEYKYPNNEMFHGAWCEGNYQFVTDSYRAVCLYNPVDVKERDKQYSLSVTQKFTDAEQCCTKEIELPSVKEIREQISNLIGRKYRSNRVLYRLGNDPNLASVNAKYLVELMECLGATTIKYYPRQATKGMLLMETDLGKAILLPVYSQTKNVGYWTPDPVFDVFKE